MIIRYDNHKKRFAVFGFKSELLKYCKTEKEAEQWVEEYNAERAIENYFFCTVPTTKLENTNA